MPVHLGVPGRQAQGGAGESAHAGQHLVGVGVAAADRHRGVGDRPDAGVHLGVDLVAVSAQNLDQAFGDAELAVEVAGVQVDVVGQGIARRGGGHGGPFGRRQGRGRAGQGDRCIGDRRSARRGGADGARRTRCAVPVCSGRTRRLRLGDRGAGNGGCRELDPIAVGQSILVRGGPGAGPVSRTGQRDRHTGGFDVGERLRGEAVEAGQRGAEHDQLDGRTEQRGRRVARWAGVGGDRDRSLTQCPLDQSCQDRLRSELHEDRCPIGGQALESTDELDRPAQLLSQHRPVGLHIGAVGGIRAVRHHQGARRADLDRRDRRAKRLDRVVDMRGVEGGGDR